MRKDRVKSRYTPADSAFQWGMVESYLIANGPLGMISVVSIVAIVVWGVIM